MLERLSGFAVIALIVSCAPVSAEDAPAVCTSVYWVLKPGANVGSFTTDMPSLRGCIEALRRRVLSRSDNINQDPTREAQNHRALIDDYRTYKLQKLWKRALKPKTPDVESGQLDKAIEDLRTAVYDKLTTHGLYVPFSGELVTGASFATAQNAASSFLGSSQSRDTSASAHIVFETRHFLDEDQSFLDVSFGGRIGFQPALSLIQRTASTGTSQSAGMPTDAAAKYQDAFGWSSTLKVNAKVTGMEGEIPFALTFGQYTLTTDTVVVDQGNIRTIAIPLGDASASQSFWEATVGLNFYGRSLHLVHAEKDFMHPLIGFTFGYKHDARFKQASDSLVKFDSPEERLVFRFLTAPFPVIMSDGAGGKKTVELSFGIEHEWMTGLNTVPSGTRILIRGDVDLLKALRPGS
jgi:hypothetical protein